MRFETKKDLKESGFDGFITISELIKNKSLISNQKGVYMVVCEDKLPEFVKKGSGGFYKGQDPNVSIEELKENWVEGTVAVYIGKAADLKKRLSMYIRFGNGKSASHWGGRYIWQIKDAGDLVMCWRPLRDEDPREVEAELIAQFKKEYGKLPFANLKG